MHIFIVCGYGIPVDIEKDANYPMYLRLIFNRVYQQARGAEVSIIPCGGPTNCNPPYEGTEAHMIGAYLKSLMERKDVVASTASWNILEEDQSLSTLENLVFAKRVIDQHSLSGDITIFCEFTRTQRVRVFADSIFEGRSIRIEGIDFDISKNRYLDPEVLEKKEALGLKEGLWTLQESVRLERHHEFFEKKFEFLRRRQAEGLSHVEAVEEWFKNEKDLMRQLMPDHPLIQE